jgi:hypothetical protein
MTHVFFQLVNHQAGMPLQDFGLLIPRDSHFLKSGEPA